MDYKSTDYKITLESFELQKQLEAKKYTDGLIDKKQYEEYCKSVK